MGLAGLGLVFASAVVLLFSIIRLVIIRSPSVFKTLYIAIKKCQCYSCPENQNLFFTR